MVLVEVQYFGIGTNYGLQMLLWCGKKVKTKSQKVLEASSYVCRSYRGKTGRGGFLVSTPILNRDKYFLNLGIPSWLNCFSDFSKKIFFIFYFIFYLCFNYFMLLYFIFVIFFFAKYESINILLHSASLCSKDIALLRREFSTCTSSAMFIKSSLYLVPFRTSTE